MDIIYDDFIETYKRELMSIVEKSKKQTLLIIAMEQKKSGYLWLQDIYIYMVMIDIQNYVQKLDINIWFKIKKLDINILNSNDYNNTQTIEKHYQYLLLSLLVLELIDVVNKKFII